MTQKRAGIYARISQKDKRVPKVENQIAICKAIIEAEGWTLADVHIFNDDGVAASGKQVDDTTLSVRPGALACIKSIRAGEFDVLVAVEGERLARTYLDGLEWIQASTEGNVTWHLDSDGPLNPATPAGEETAVSIFASGRREGRIRAQRQKRRYDRELESGQPLWGVRPFGFEPDGITVREEEAAHIRAAVEAYLSHGKSLLKIAQDWTALGLKTDGMKRERRGRDGETRLPAQHWTATTVRQMLLRPRNAGILVNRGVEMPVSKIQPIITVDQHGDLKGRIKLGTPVESRAHSLLGGIVKCECGASMHATTSYSKRKGGPRYEYRNYKCQNALVKSETKHASIKTQTVDDLVTAFTITALLKGDLTAPDGEEIPAALRALSDRLTTNSEAIAHVSAIIRNPTLKTLHGAAIADLQKYDLERETLEAERDALLARSAEGGALAMFMDQWREKTAGYADAEEQEAWHARLWETWEGVPLETKRALIRARFRPIIKRGGRGAGRVYFAEGFAPKWEPADRWGDDPIDRSDPTNWAW
jgi:site-specific DNA recombinase